MRRIPSPQRIEDKNLRDILEAMRERLEVLFGERGPTEDRALLVSDLTEMGLIGVAEDNVTLYDKTVTTTPIDEIAPITDPEFEYTQFILTTTTGIPIVDSSGAQLVSQPIRTDFVDPEDA